MAGGITHSNQLLVTAGCRKAGHIYLKKESLPAGPAATGGTL
jgi:hypothetical protein